MCDYMLSTHAAHAARQHLRWSTKCLAWNNGMGWVPMGWDIRVFGYGYEEFSNWAPVIRPLRPISLARSTDGMN